MISGTVTVVLGGASMVYDIYKLNNELGEIAKLGTEGASEFRTMAKQLEDALKELQTKPQTNEWFSQFLTFLVTCDTIIFLYDLVKPSNEK